MLLPTPTIAEEEVPDTQQCVEGEVAGEKAHQPISGEHEWLHTVALQVSVSRQTHPLQNPAQHRCVKQDPLLYMFTQHTECGGCGQMGGRVIELTVGVVVRLCFFLPAAGCSIRAGTVH